MQSGGCGVASEKRHHDPDTDEDRGSDVWSPNGDPDDIDWISNEGIRTSRLVAFLGRQP